MKMPSKEFFGQMFLSMLGGGMLGPFGLGYLMNYGGNNGCFAWADALYGVPGYESCGQLGLHAGVVLGSLIGFFAWRYISFIRTFVLRGTLLRVVGLYIISVCVWLIFFLRHLWSGILFGTDPEALLYAAMATTFFLFASALSIVPFLIYKGIQRLAVKK